MPKPTPDAFKPLIGVTPGLAGPSENREFARASDVLYCGVDYVNRIAEAGGVPVLLTLTEDPDAIHRMVDVMDGLLLTGGEDVDPELYGQEPLMPGMIALAERDRFELELLKQFLVTEKPVLAICRGHQVLNVALGGTLIQDIPSVNGVVHHSQSTPPPATTHHVELREDSLAAHVLGTTSVNVNSYHHQAVDHVAPSLRVTGRSEEGFVEALEHNKLPYVMGVQWHPERLCVDGSNQHLLFESFVDACRGVQRDRA
jgi:putative glutamine amidotransferase